MISKTLKATYNKKFAETWVYGGQQVFVLSDSAIEIEHTAQQAVKIQTSDVAVTKIDGIPQLSINEITTHNSELLKIISWQYHGNKSEEIIFVLEGSRRGL